MTRVAIIGIGSPAGDDQAGWCVAHALQRSAWPDRPSCQVSVTALDRPGTRLIRYLEGADAAVLIDAMRSGREPGFIQRVDDPALLGPDTSASSHGLGVASALELARALDLLPGTLILYGIEIGEVSFNAAPSAAVRHAAAAVAAMIEAGVAERWPCLTPLSAAKTPEPSPHACGSRER
jgi:hydrogenase maturation protease